MSSLLAKVLVRKAVKLAKASGRGPIQTSLSKSGVSKAQRKGNVASQISTELKRIDRSKFNKIFDTKTQTLKSPVLGRVYKKVNTTIKQLRDSLKKYEEKK
jgi:hypothetical protein